MWAPRLTLKYHEIRTFFLIVYGFFYSIAKYVWCGLFCGWVPRPFPLIFSSAFLVWLPAFHFITTKQVGGHHGDKAHGTIEGWRPTHIYAVTHSKRGAGWKRGLAHWACPIKPLARPCKREGVHEFVCVCVCLWEHVSFHEMWCVFQKSSARRCTCVSAFGLSSRTDTALSYGQSKAAPRQRQQRELGPLVHECNAYT